MARPSSADLVERLLKGETAALPRLISLVEQGDPAVPEIMERVRPHTGRAQRIGVTGPPGAGKSTLVDALIAHYRREGKSVGILGVDPTSPFTGGALLGDRVRMRRHYLDPGVFIRSMATRGARGGLPAVAMRVLKLLDAAGKDILFLETVGVGQTELAIMEAVDTTLVVLVPEAGDAIQIMKAGLLEVADIFVVNKVDRPGSKRMVADLETAVHLGARHSWWVPPVLPTEAYRSVGVNAVAQAIGEHRRTLEETGHLEEMHREQRRQELLAVVRDELLAQLEKRIEEDGRLAKLRDRVVAGEVDPFKAATQVLEDPALLREWLASLDVSSKS